MADHIPFLTSEEGKSLVEKYYTDSEVVRVSLHRAEDLLPRETFSGRIWLDPSVDGMDELLTRQNSWLDFMTEFPNFRELGDPSRWEKPDAAEVYAFVKALLGQCAKFKPAWITVPQIPLSNTSARNKINRVLASATGKWKSTTGYSGRLILPLVFTHQDQVNLKTARNAKVLQAERCYHDAQADGFWAVDKSLADDNGSSTLRNKRFPGLICLHEELNEHITSKIRIAGPYWGMNLVLWARGLVDYPAIGVGAGYRLFLSGGHAKPPTVKLALPSLRRRVVVAPRLRTWLAAAIKGLSPSHPCHSEFSDILNRYTTLSQKDTARRQVAKFYMKWFNSIDAAPKAGRSMALFQDLSAAYALGKALPNLEEEGTARRPEAVVEPLMLSCL